jgi:hypothetical protein
MTYLYKKEGEINVLKKQVLRSSQAAEEVDNCPWAEGKGERPIGQQRCLCRGKNKVQYA